jgi:DMSO/TMAO reductase YedYZ heme-binding membrane subunit
VATTRSRPRGRETARSSSDGIIAAEHATKIYGIAVSGVVVIIAFLALTSTGHVIDAATQHFMLYYAGVFALIALCASVGLGLVATDRMVLGPGHRVFVQSAHRAASFGAVAFLIIHIVTEILAQRSHVLDAFVPFLSPFKTFYIGLGTIASDLILMLVITSIVRKRFTAHGKAWRWRAIHYTSYVAFVFGVWHGLLGGRAGKPYVDWSYGFVVAFVAVGLAVRILANSLRPKENLSGPPVAESASSASAPMRAASMFAQLGVVRAAASASAAVSAPTAAQGMLSAPVGGWNTGPATGPTPALAAIPTGPAEYGNNDGRQPLYEPGYVGPPRYMGAPRSDRTGPMPQAGTGPQPQAPVAALPRAATGPQPRAATGPQPRANTGPQPRANTGSQPRAATGPHPRVNTGPLPRAATGSQPRAATGSQPRLGQPGQTGGIPQVGDGPVPGRGTGPMPRAASGPMPRAASGPMPRVNSGPMPQSNSGPVPRAGTGPMPADRTTPLPTFGRPAHGGGSGGAGGGSAPRGGSGPRAGTGPMPRAGTGPQPRTGTGPVPRAATGPMPRAGTGPQPGAGAGPQPRQGASVPPGGRWGARPGAGRNPRGQAQPAATIWNDAADWTGTAGGDVTWNYDMPPWDGGAPEPDLSLRYREPGPGMPGYRGGHDPYRGGDELR